MERLARKERLDQKKTPLFWHFVKVGANNIQIRALLEKWRDFKKTPEYAKMRRSSVAKSAYENHLKRKRDSK